MMMLVLSTPTPGPLTPCTQQPGQQQDVLETLGRARGVESSHSEVERCRGCRVLRAQVCGHSDGESVSGRTPLPSNPVARPTTDTLMKQREGQRGVVGSEKTVWRQPPLFEQVFAGTLYQHLVAA